MDLKAISDPNDRSLLANLPQPALSALEQTLATGDLAQAAVFLTALEKTGWSETLLDRVFLTIQRQFGDQILQVLQQALPVSKTKRVREVLLPNS